MPQSFRTKGFVLRRTNFGEADRILNILTEDGYITAIAKGVRKEKSKLAGGIELCCLSEYTYYEWKNDSMRTLTSAKMLEHYDAIPVSVEKLELVSLFFKKISRLAADAEGRVYFDFLHELFDATNSSDNLQTIEAWFWLNLARISGEAVNFSRDIDGNPLEENIKYIWNQKEQALESRIGGDIDSSAIKLVRFMLNSSLKDTLRIKDAQILIPSIIVIGKSINRTN